MPQNQQQETTHDVLMDKIVELLRDASERELDLVYRFARSMLDKN